MPPQKITHLLYARVIPWLTSQQTAELVAASPAMSSAMLPKEVSLSRLKISGERETVKGQRKHGNQRLHIANWPHDNLHELSVAKVCCVISGHADMLVSKYCLHGGPGTFILIPPHLPHQRFGPFLQANRRHNESCTIIHAYAHSHGILFWLTQSSLDRHSNDMRDNYLIPSMTAMQLLHLAIDEAKATKASFQLVGSNLLAAFFAVIAREIESGNYNHPGPEKAVPPSHKATASFADQVRKYTEANCHKILHVRDAATHFFMSSSQFSRRMRQETGMTFIELLTLVRIERAQQMLRETDLTFVAISNYLSFKSSTQFHHLFRRQVGCSPMEYRKVTASSPTK